MRCWGQVAGIHSRLILENHKKSKISSFYDVSRFGFVPHFIHKRDSTLCYFQCFSVTYEKTVKVNIQTWTRGVRLLLDNFHFIATICMNYSLLMKNIWKKSVQSYKSVMLSLPRL